MQEKFLKELIELSKKAKKKDEVPVAAIIVKDNRIVAKAYNKKEKNNNPIMHAEVVVILKVIKKIKDWRLSDYELYVTLEPCDMCKSIIEETRIKKVYYLCDKEQKQKNRTEYIRLKTNKLNEYQNLLKDFFKNKR